MCDSVTNTAERAEKEGVTPTKLYAYGLKTKHNAKKKVAEVGKQLFNNNNEFGPKPIPFTIASAIYDCGKMTRRIYTNIRYK